MINLKNDYCGICHQRILDALAFHQNEYFTGYGTDQYSNLAKDAIKKLINNPNALVLFTIGGTSTNKIFLSHALKQYEAVISADTGHINTHETGAIEATGHKVLTVPNRLGKIYPKDIEKIINGHKDSHMVKPRAIYVSNSTELGTVYTKKELLDLYNLCKKYNLYFYIDGARLGAALASRVCDYQMADLAKMCDGFYIGGTKNGLLLGEALVITNEELIKDINYSVKTSGGLLAKGFLNGIQFYELFKDNLFLDIAKKENTLAQCLKEELNDLGITFLIDSPTNQIFPIVDKTVVEKIKDKIDFEIWEENDDEVVLRFVTSFLTTDRDIEEAIKIFKIALA